MDSVANIFTRLRFLLLLSGAEEPGGERKPPAYPLNQPAGGVGELVRFGREAWDRGLISYEWPVSPASKYKVVN